MLLGNFSTDALLKELLRRDGVLFHRVRAIIEGEGVPQEEELALYHNATVVVRGTTVGVVEMQVMIDGEFRSPDWKPPEFTGHEKCRSDICFNPAKYHQCPARVVPIHAGEYD